jgi:Pentapeptide repeats (9 copies)
MSDAQKPELRRANDNPWYCLATLHGEQPIDRLDQELAEKNLQAWRNWIGGILESNNPDEFLNAFAARTGRPEPPPKLAQTIDFSHTHFDRSVSFYGYPFLVPADFNSATFSGEASFGLTQFNGETNFCSATFSGKTNFGHAQFKARGDFRSATFSKGVDFQNSYFINPNFCSVTFGLHANFNSARFSGTGITSFNSVIFSSGSDFGNAVFEGGADFGLASFCETVSFNAATFNIANFESAIFSNPIRFINTKFNGSTIFVHARFKAAPPDFRGATMHEATEWHGVTWPKPPWNKAGAQRHVYFYERLKQEMERLKKHEDEQIFFRKELRARRGLAQAVSGAWLLNFLYEALSDYGQSVGRPAFWLVICFASGYFIFAGTHVFNGTHLTREKAAALSFANIFSFLPMRREIMTDELIKGLTSWAQAIGVVQSLLGAILLFLFGLALRNRFRMK